MTQEFTHRFTITDYEAILQAAHVHGYGYGLFTDPEPELGAYVVYLRHDIDNCIDSALRMAEVEARSGAVSTYLVMLRSENYNPLTGGNIGKLRRIRDLGHEVGLHFAPDGHQQECRERDLDARIRADVRLLEEALGAPVRVFSFHNPTEGDGFRIEVPGLANAYADRFFGNAYYLSESNMRWPQGLPVDVLAAREHPVVQILVHPLSYRADFRSDRDVLLWFLRDTVRRLMAVNVDQNRTLREENVSMADVATYLLKDAGQ